jgi:hypothetical protein
VREEEGGGQGMPAARGGGGGRLREEGLVNCVFSPPKAPLYIGGRGCTLPPPQGNPRAAAKGGGGQRWLFFLSPSWASFWKLAH